MSAAEAVAVALWIVHTHAFDDFRFTPRLGVTSPERNCGKTTLMSFLSYIVRSGILLSHVTPPAVFHEIENNQATLLLDEADTSFEEKQLITILNSGFQRDSAYVMRALGQNGTQRFITWAPMAYAVLDQIPDTLASRSIIIDLKRKGKDQKCLPLDERAINSLKKLKRRVKRWCVADQEAMKRAVPEIPEELQNRAADVWTPLFAIADIAGGGWPDLARDAAKRLVKKEQPSLGSQLLSDIQKIFANRGDKKIASSNLVKELAALEGRPWPDFEGHRGITATAVAKLLASYRISPKNLRFGDRVLRGYEKRQFKDAFGRYLRPRIKAS